MATRHSQHSNVSDVDGVGPRRRGMQTPRLQKTPRRAGTADLALSDDEEFYRHWLRSTLEDSDKSKGDDDRGDDDFDAPADDSDPDDSGEEDEGRDAARQSSRPAGAVYAIGARREHSTRAEGAPDARGGTAFRR